MNGPFWRTKEANHRNISNIFYFKFEIAPIETSFNLLLFDAFEILPCSIGNFLMIEPESEKYFGASKVVLGGLGQNTTLWFWTKEFIEICTTLYYVREVRVVGGGVKFGFWVLCSIWTFPLHRERLQHKLSLDVLGGCNQPWWLKRLLWAFKVWAWRRS